MCWPMAWGYGWAFIFIRLAMASEPGYSGSHAAHRWSDGMHPGRRGVGSGLKAWGERIGRAAGQGPRVDAFCCSGWEPGATGFTRHPPERRPAPAVRHTVIPSAVPRERDGVEQSPFKVRQRAGEKTVETVVGGEVSRQPRVETSGFMSVVRQGDCSADISSVEMTCRAWVWLEAQA